MSKYTAAIIEITKNIALPFVLQNFIENLNDDWAFIIFHGNGNKEYIENVIYFQFKQYNNRITIVQFDINDIKNNYDYMWKYKGIYDSIPTETFLVFNTNSIIIPENKHLIHEFMEYDYVGAPWTDEVVGNGGLSLRKKSKMLEIIDTCEPNDKNEDEFFTRQNKVALYRPSFEKAKQFSVETVFYDSPFGIHNCYRDNYLSSEKLNFLIELYPDIKKLKELNINNNNVEYQKFTLVYKTYKNDLEWLRYSLLSLQEFLYVENIFEIIIYSHNVVEKEVHNLLESIQMSHYVQYRVLPVNYNIHGYIKQMVVKANCYKDCRTNYIVLLDSDLILKTKLNFESFIKEDGKLEWYYLNKEDDPNNKVFTVWKKAVEDSTRSPQNIHYMSNGFPFIFTKKSLEDAAIKFKELNDCNYEVYCENRCRHENININESIKDIFNKLSKVWTEFEYLGFYCHHYSKDYIFIPTQYCKMKDQFKNPGANSFFVQYWSHGGLDQNIRNQITNIIKKQQKTVIQVLTQTVDNLKADNCNNFWGLGDMIRGTIALFQLSKKHNFRLIVDIQLHPISKYLKYNIHEYSELIQKNKNNIRFIYPDKVENHILNSNDNVIYFLTNDFFHEGITNECKEFIKNLLTPNLEFEKYIQDIKVSKPPPERYSILHFRLGDSFLVRNENNFQFNQIKEKLFRHYDNDDILMSDSNRFKETIMTNHPNIFLYHIHVAHMGVQMHTKYIKDTLFEFILVTRSSKIKTHSVYGHISGFVKIAHEIYDIPLIRI